MPIPEPVELATQSVVRTSRVPLTSKEFAGLLVPIPTLPPFKAERIVEEPALFKSWNAVVPE